MNPPQTVPPIDPRYPIGRFPRTEMITLHMREAAVARLAELPEELFHVVDGLSDAQLSTPYREGGWTVRQLVHHVADSHANAYLRIRLALTEDAPTICTYDEKAWAELHDSIAPVAWSIQWLEALHARLVMLLQSLDAQQWKRVFIHPEKGPVTVEMAALEYAWHSRHHVAHIAHLRAVKGW
ncbi:metal-dependent hydrolase [Terriglobus saanensis SP1PR4]|uniref:Metal-dependent hydrolase n=2 Tax=Terriglobus saanensis TaxID=870903 RepID=E8V3V5_TERSS|nr:metal-dependent hydrolase [Terriglobus saanensis SP1PR4]